jgi:hypothetical protein
MPSVREGLARYHAANGFAGDAMTAKTLQMKVFGMTLDMPNPPFQRALLARHDLHHVLTGYGTDLRGEAEMGAWEIAAAPWLRPRAFGRLVPADEVRELTEIIPVPRWLIGAVFVWSNNVGALFLGLLAPIRTIRAFARGLRCRSLYDDDGASYDELLSLSIAELEGRLGLARR